MRFMRGSCLGILERRAMVMVNAEVTPALLFGEIGAELVARLGGMTLSQSSDMVRWRNRFP